MSLVTQNFVQDCNVPIDANDSAVHILGVAGSRLDIIGNVELSIHVFDRIIRHKFYVKTGKLTFGCDFIFGIDLIHHYRLVCHPTSKTVTFLDPTVASRMQTSEPKRLSKLRRKGVRFRFLTVTQ